MKTTRLILAFAAALSLGLAVFANIRADHNAVASDQAPINSDELVTSDAGAVVTGTPVADDNCAIWDTDRAHVDRVEVACTDRLEEANHS
jgi:hypothetical protein